MIHINIITQIVHIDQGYETILPLNIYICHCGIYCSVIILYYIVNITLNIVSNKGGILTLLEIL